MDRESSLRNRILGIVIGVAVGLVTLAVGETDVAVETTPKTHETISSEEAPAEQPAHRSGAQDN